jgi:hypothetical protein
MLPALPPALLAAGAGRDRGGVERRVVAVGPHAALIVLRGCGNGPSGLNGSSDVDDDGDGDGAALVVGVNLHPAGGPDVGVHLEVRARGGPY